MAKDPISLRPIINDLIHTDARPNGATLLVDRISILRPTRSSLGSGEQAFRLWLSDGSKVIQAVLKHNLHPYLAAGCIVEGSYVELTESEVIDVKRSNSNEFICILQIDDLNVVGHDGRNPVAVPCHEFRPDNDCSVEERRGQATLVTTPSNSLSMPADSPGRLSQILKQSQKSQGEATTICEDDHDSDEVSLTPTRQTRNALEEEEELEMPESPTRPKRKREVTSSPLEATSDNRVLRPTKAPKIGNNRRPAKTPEPLAIEEKQISRPLTITPLAKIIGPRTIRNKIHDVLAVVCSVDDQVIRRRGMPEQRNLRITDQSTTRLVQLTVFVNATQFKPAIGTVALFRNVTTHEWNGGSLKAYQRDCAGVRWFFPNPADVDQKMVTLLRHCWESRKLVPGEN